MNGNLDDAIQRVAEKLLAHGADTIEGAEEGLLILLCTYMAVMMREAYQGIEVSFQEENPSGLTDKTTEAWANVWEGYLKLRRCLNENGHHCF